MKGLPGSSRRPVSARRVRPVAVPVPLERAVQREIREMLGAFGFGTFHIPNGAQLAGDPKSRARQMRALRGDGLVPGFPDLGVIGLPYGISRGGVGFLEVKRARGGKVSAAQGACHAWLQERGVRLAVVRSADEAIAALYDWGWL